MEDKKTNSSYEQLYSELVTYALSIHDRNKRRIKYGSLGFLILPVVLFLIRWITDSDKVVFLIIWIIGVFILSVYLIGVEYLDASIRKKLKEMTNREAKFDSLLESGLYEKYEEGLFESDGHGLFSAKIRKRIDELREHDIDIDMDPEDVPEEADKEGDDE